MRLFTQDSITSWVIQNPTYPRGFLSKYPAGTVQGLGLEGVQILGFVSKQPVPSGAQKCMAGSVEERKDQRRQQDTHGVMPERCFLSCKASPSHPRP